MKRKDLDIWRVERDASGAWGTPVRLPEPVNSEGQEWFPRPAPDGWLYFGSNRPGGLGRTDIWRARAGSDGRWTVENLGPAINTAGDEYEPLPSPDGARMIVMASDGLYETRRTDAGWSPRVKLPPAVNVNGSEIGAVFSPSGRTLLFARDTKGPDSGEFFVLREDGDEDWPPPAPRPASLGPRRSSGPRAPRREHRRAAGDEPGEQAGKPDRAGRQAADRPAESERHQSAAPVRQPAGAPRAQAQDDARRDATDRRRSRFRWRT